MNPARRPIRTVLVTGDRHWEDRQLIADVLAAYRPTTIIEGEARGADTLAREAAQVLGIAVAAFPADWARYGRGAGPVRNQQMLHAGMHRTAVHDPDACFAFHDNLDASKGTRDMVRRCRLTGVPVLLVSHAQPEGRWL